MTGAVGWLATTVLTTSSLSVVHGPAPLQRPEAGHDHQRGQRPGEEAPMVLPPPVAAAAWGCPSSPTFTAPTAVSTPSQSPASSAGRSSE